MSYFTMQRDRTVTSTDGHAIFFKKGEPTYVPPEMHTDVMDKGAEPAEDPLEKPEVPEPPLGGEGETSSAPEPTDPDQRQSALFAAYDRIVQANRREDFTAGNAPTTGAIKAVTGWAVTAGERDESWVAYNQRNQS